MCRLFSAGVRGRRRLFFFFRLFCFIVFLFLNFHPAFQWLPLGMCRVLPLPGRPSPPVQTQLVFRICFFHISYLYFIYLIFIKFLHCPSIPSGYFYLPCTAERGYNPSWDKCLPPGHGPRLKSSWQKCSFISESGQPNMFWVCLVSIFFLSADRLLGGGCNSAAFGAPDSCIPPSHIIISSYL